MTPTDPAPDPGHEPEVPTPEPVAGLAYDIVDVFTDRAFAGNPLAVVYDTEGLSTAQLQSLAQEFNLSETAFPSRGRGDAYDVRIFTPTTEIPFAGHPTLGTAWALAARGELRPGPVIQHCGAGEIEVDLPDDPAGPVELAASPRDDSGPADAALSVRVAELIGLGADDIAGPLHVGGCGLSWLHLPVTADALTRARPTGRPVSDLDLSGLEIGDPLDGVNAYVLTEPGSGSWLSVRSRVFVPGYGIPEDPATGSAAVGLGVALAARGAVAPEGDTAYQITQGVEMGRPSRLSGRVRTQDGRAARCWVSGRVAAVASGTIRLP